MASRRQTIKQGSREVPFADRDLLEVGYISHGPSLIERMELMGAPGVDYERMVELLAVRECRAVEIRDALGIKLDKVYNMLNGISRFDWRTGRRRPWRGYYVEVGHLGKAQTWRLV